MKITHKIDDFLVELFPQYKKSNLDLNILKDEITKYFTVEPYQPRVSIDGDWISRIRPGRDDYKLNAIPGKIFSGYQMLAWYYVSFKLALPEIVDQLGLNYEKEYEMAAKLNTAN